ncbi:nucleoside triphosphate pyrophosphatase [Maricaulis sp.]|uniref:Maf family protein n=1 Tax=Maricaulis sp. TaxID=1486257 RepID=UPI001B2F23F8|nr:nucleoside triphosphate pyrophosphatase [Maricaulis sp.]MBO6763412.1 septum formation protein Maf [Maricaulis sp.]
MTDFVLASGSQIRRQILDNAGIDFSVEKPDVDESVIKEQRSDLSPAEMALVLGKAKAEAVSRGRPKALVLGADQTMELDGSLLDKLPDAALARDRLMAMRGRSHQLHSGLALYRDGECVWQHQQSSTLHVRAFSDAFLDDYLERAGFALTASVGAYAFEGLGAQLFEKIDGDYYAILGLPLLPLLDALREFDVIPA